MCLLDRIGVSSPSQERGSHMWMKYIQYLCDATALFFSIFHEFIHACREGGHRKTTKTSRRQTAGDHCRAGDAACDHRVVHVVLCAILCVCVCVCTCRQELGTNTHVEENVSYPVGCIGREIRWYTYAFPIDARSVRACVCAHFLSVHIGSTFVFAATSSAVPFPSSILQRHTPHQRLHTASHHSSFVSQQMIPLHPAFSSTLPSVLQSSSPPPPPHSHQPTPMPPPLPLPGYPTGYSQMSRTSSQRALPQSLLPPALALPSLYSYPATHSYTPAAESLQTHPRLHHRHSSRFRNPTNEHNHEFLKNQQHTVVGFCVPPRAIRKNERSA